VGDLKGLGLTDLKVFIGIIQSSEVFLLSCLKVPKQFVVSDKIARLFRKINKILKI